jgi:hypothetical protein
MTKEIIMVQIADRAWTLNALHRACTLARRTDSEIVLVKMLPVQHMNWLGTEFGNMHFTQQDRADLQDFQATVEDYGVPYSALTFQYFSLAEALSDVADHVTARLVFATLPKSILPFWYQFQLRGLCRRLSCHGRQLIAIEDNLLVSFAEMASVG